MSSTAGQLRAALAIGDTLDAPTFARAQLREAAQGRSLRGAEDEVLRLEAAVPGVGGFYQDTATGRLVVLVRDEFRQQRAVTTALGALSQRLRPGNNAVEPLAHGRVDVRHADYAFSELLGYVHVLQPRAVAIPGVVAFDADERANRVVVTVTNSAAEPAVLKAAAAAGVPAAAVRVQLGPQPMAMTAVTDAIRLTGGGLQIQASNGERCTLGWNVTTTQGEVGMLTAAHCSASGPGYGPTGETLYQSTSPNDAFATVTINNPFDVSQYSCQYNYQGSLWTGLCTNADAMFAASTVGRRQVARLAVPTGEQRGTRTFTLSGSQWISAIKPPAFAFVGATADKVGRTTGWTHGSVAATCVDVLTGDARTGRSYVVKCADQVTGAGVGGGNSGSPTFRLITQSGYPDGVVYPLGVLFAGSPANQTDLQDGTSYCNSNCYYFYSTWTQIQAHLARTFDPSTIQ